MENAQIKELSFFITQRIIFLNSLMRAFDFIHKNLESDIIPANFKNKTELIETQSNLIIVCYSFVYSLFDKRGINIMNLKEASLSSDLTQILNEIISLWTPLKKPMTIIRHNFGFHGVRGHQINSAINSVNEIDKNKLLYYFVFLLKKLDQLKCQLEKEILSKT